MTTLGRNVMKIYKGIAVALTAAILASGGGITSSLLTAQPAQAASTQPEIDSAIAQILSETNAERVKAGLEPLILNSQMSKVSQTWSEYMATKKTMYHNPSYTNQLPKPWIRVGENVGQGYTQSTIVPAWMASEGHRSNILGSFTHIGIGYWVDETGRGWFTQNFGKYEQPVLTEINAPDTTVGKFDITSTWLAKWDEVVHEYQSELYDSTGALLQTKKTTAPTVSFTGLTDNTTYTVKTTARVSNALGEVFISPAKTYNLTTAEDLPTVTAPTNLTLKAGEDTVEASWTASADVNGTLAPYTVELLKGTTVVESVQTADLNFVFSGVTSNTDYKVNVIATSSVRAKTATAVATANTKTLLSSKAEISEPNNVVITADAHSTIKATWTAPDEKVGVGLKYILTLSSAGKPDVVVQTTSTSHSFSSLRSETLYAVKVQAYIVSEDGNVERTTAGVSKSVTTPINYDEVSVTAPTLKPVLVESSKATFGWTAPTSVVGKFVNYTLTVKQAGQADRVFNTPLDYYVVTGLKENTAYTFELKANATSLNGSFFASSTPATATHTTPYAPSTAIVSAPRTLAVTSPAYNQVNASWTAPANVVGTVTGYKATLKAGATVIKTQTVTGLNTSFTGLDDSGYYTVEVVALAASPDKTTTATSTVANGNVVTAAHVDAPNAPTNFKVDSTTSADATLSWVAPTGVYGNIIDYTVTLKETGKADRVLRSPGTTYKVTGLAENSSYTAQVVANVVSRNGVLLDVSPSVSLEIRTPYSPSTVKVSAPTGVKLSEVTHDSLKVSWVAPAGTVGKVTGYSIVVKQGTTVVKTVPVNGSATSTTVTSLNELTDYGVTVEATATAENGVNTSKAASTAASATTSRSAASTVQVSAPASLAATATSGSVNATWTAPTFTGTLTGYTVLVKENGVTVKTFTTTDTKATISGLKEKTSYMIEVTANAASSNGLYKATSTAVSKAFTTVSSLESTVAVTTPSTFTATPVYNSIKATWVKPAATGTVTGYRVILRLNGVEVKKVYPTSTATTVTFTGLKEKTGYTVEIRAYAKSPNGLVEAISSTTKKTATTGISLANTVKVATPSTLVATPSYNTIKATWTKPSVTGIGTGYRVILRLNGVEVKKVYPTDGVTTAIFTGLKEKTGYTVEIRAYAKSSSGLFTAISGTTVKTATTGISLANTAKVSTPSTLALTPTFNSIKATWAKPAVTGTVTGYRVILRVKGVEVKRYYPTSTATTFTFTGLKERTAYTVDIVAYAKSSNGIYSTTSATTTKSVTTPATPTASKVSVSPMAALVASSPTRSTITASWLKPSYTGTLNGYYITIKQGSTLIKAYSTTSLKASFSGLRANTAYTITVKAVVKSPNGLYSATSATSKVVTTRR